MEFQIITPEDIRHDNNECIALGIFTDSPFNDTYSDLNADTVKFIQTKLNNGDFIAKTANTLLLFNPPGVKTNKLLLLGLGKQSEYNFDKYSKVQKSLYEFVSKTNLKSLSNYTSFIAIEKRDIGQRVKQSIMSLAENDYTFEQCKSIKSSSEKTLSKLSLLINSADQKLVAEQSIQQAVATNTGIELAKDLGNLPANICTPSYLADIAIALAEQYKPVSCKIHNEDDMRAMGMHSLLCVSQGSHEEAKLIELHYKGAQDAAPLILVGKGVTFDSGGISLKPGLDMDTMKFDMCGAASVIGTIKAVAELELPLNLTVIVPATENLPGGKAVKPGDIVTSMSGQTIEIINTDAEGRLILCDALTYCEKFKPKAVIDVATLTGAIIVALGTQTMGLFSNNDELAKQVLHSCEKSAEPAWQLPMWDVYQSDLDSNFADMANAGNRNAGSIFAACFLSRFCKEFDWVHLDIAGIAFKSGKDKGSTGKPVASLTQIAIDMCQ